MKPSHYLAIAVRLFSVVLFLYALRQSSILMEVIRSNSLNGAPVSIFFILATTLSPFAASIFLWFFPFTVSNLILKPEIDKTIEPMNAHSVLTVLVLSIGLYIFFYALIDSIYWVTLWHMSSQSQYASASLYLADDNKANMLATAVELAASVAILLKAKTLSYRILRLTK